MMNLVSRCSERTPVALSSIASESPRKTRHESQNPLSPQTEKYDRTGRPVVCAHSSRYAEWNIDKTWSSQEWISDELMDDRTGRPVVCSQHTNQFIIENDETNSYTEAESAKTILKRCNKRQLQTFFNMENVYVFNIASICIHGEELLRQLAFHQKYRRSHNETDVRHIWEMDIRTIRWDLWNKYI